MRVVHVSAYYAPAFAFGGPPRSIHGLCLALRSAGLDIQVLTTDADGGGRLPREVAERRSFEGVPVRYCPRSWPARVIGSRALSAEAVTEFRQADVVHIHGLWNRVVWAAAKRARQAGIPYVLSPRGMLDEGSLRHHRWQKRLTYPFADRGVVLGAAVIHATSEDEARGIRTWRPTARVEVIPNGIEPDLADVILTRAELDVPSERDLVVFVGRIHPVKRLDLLLDAFGRVREAWPRAHLVIAGPDEQGLRPSLEARAGASRSAISWLGRIDADRRDALLRHASVFVMCSDSESFGLAALEALRAGAPVVVSDTCGWEAIAREGAGLVVPQTPAAIAAGVLDVLRAPDEARRMGERGRAFAVRDFAWSHIAARVAAVYGSLAGRVDPR